MSKINISKLPNFDPEFFPDLKVIVGLGNPGQKFSKNRHNAGFLFLDKMADFLGVRFESRKNYQFVVWNFVFEEQARSIVLVKPQTFMNNSGDIFKDLFSYFKVNLDQVLVAHDELEKKPGTFAFKFAGSHRGNNGLRSIIQQEGDQFHRLRIGVGRPENREDVGNYVLSNFSQSEIEDIDVFVEEFLRFLQG